MENTNNRLQNEPCESGYVVDTLVRTYSAASYAASNLNARSVASAHSSQLSEVNISNSRGDNSSDYKSSDRGLKSFFMHWYLNLFNYRHVGAYFKCLLFVLMVNLLCFMINFMQATLIRPPQGEKWNNENTLAVISLLSACLAILNSAIIAYLVMRPRAVLSGFSYTLIIFQIMLYICEIIVFYQPDPNNSSAPGDETPINLLISAICTITLFALQLLDALIVYRYWDFMTFNYDGSTFHSLRSSLLDRSQGSPHPGMRDGSAGVSRWLPDEEEEEHLRATSQK